jgi:hypothetical protein
MEYGVLKEYELRAIEKCAQACGYKTERVFVRELEVVYANGNYWNPLEPSTLHFLDLIERFGKIARLGIAIEDTNTAVFIENVKLKSKPVQMYAPGSDRRTLCETLVRAISHFHSICTRSKVYQDLISNQFNHQPQIS